MAIETTCPSCGRQLRVGNEHAGRQARCPSCQHVFTVPSPATSEPIFADPLPSSSPQRWLVQTPDGKTYGPVDKRELDRWLAEGRLTPTCQLRRETESVWRPASAVYASLSASAFEPDHVNFDPDAGYDAQNPYAAPQAEFSFESKSVHSAMTRMYRKPHRGGVVLALGILSWMICAVLGAMAWSMGNSDLKEMRAGRMDNSGYSLTQVGMILGAVHCGLIIACIVIFVILGIFGAIR